MSRPSRIKDVELHPDGWQRFERAMAVVVKAPPQHRIANKPKASRAKKSGRKAKKAVG